MITGDDDHRVEHTHRVKHLTQSEVAARWRLSPRTLERWRTLGVGPCWLRLHGRVLYRLEDVEAHELVRLRGSGD